MTYRNTVRKFISKRKKIIIVIGFVLLFIIIILFFVKQSLVKKYNALESIAVKDRHGETISVKANSKGQYAVYGSVLPTHVEDLLLKKEDRFFYWHFGINPVSLVRATIKYITGGNAGGSSTITQQLVKNLLGNEQDRSLLNKFDESIQTIALETFLSKKQILEMYANTVYMGNKVQGLYEASELYFDKPLTKLNDSEITSLLATLSSPTAVNPWKPTNISSATILAQRLHVEFQPTLIHVTSENSTFTDEINTPTNFEFSTLKAPCTTTCVTTLDKNLTEKLREILARNVKNGTSVGIKTGSIIVIKVPENQILAIVGSPNPTDGSDGHNIDMAIEPRPIGSTAKPFIYLKAFELGVRPYTQVLDREYKYTIAGGFPFYPKNYDGLYHGLVTVHEALSNSYNIPTVKTLEYIGLPHFYDFLEHTLDFKPLQDLDSYQYGIALGGLEMDALTLAHDFTLFPQNGVLKPLKLFLDKPEPASFYKPPMSLLGSEKKVADPKYVELVTRILNDRKTGVEQFGLESNLNLTQDNYAVKTGTSRDYHDSWTIGYTPDFVVAVWVGNAENKALEHVTGSQGAGRVWNESMELLFNSEYNYKTPFTFLNTKEVLIDNSLDFALKDDVISDHRNILEDKSLILSPHTGDQILLEPKTTIPLRAKQAVDWYEGNNFLGHNDILNFTPHETRTYTFRAVRDSQSETVSISVLRK